MISKELSATLGFAVKEAKKRRHEYVCVEHVLYAILYDSSGKEIIEHCGGNIERIKSRLLKYFTKHVECINNAEDYNLQQTVGFQRVIQRAVSHVKSAEKEKVAVGDILASILLESNSHAAYFLIKEDISRIDVLNYISHGISKETLNKESTQGKKKIVNPLTIYTTNLVKEAEKGNLDPLIGRDTEISRTIQVLCRRRKNNPIFVGEPGVGKTAMAEGLAQRIAFDKIPDLLKNTSIYSLDLGALLAGTKFRGDFEQRLKNIISALKQKKKAVLFIDEIHTIIGAGATSSGTMDASNILKPVLANKQIQCIGSTTYEEYNNQFNKDRAFSRRFEKIEISEPDVADTYKILTGLKSYYEKHHDIFYTDKSLKAAAELSAKYINDKFMPDKAIDVIDEVGAYVRLNSSASKKSINVTDIETIVSQMAKIPSQSVSSNDKTNLKSLGRRLKDVVFGQDTAIDALVSSIKRSRAGLGKTESTIGSFLFTGPTGVGKTEVSKQLAQVLGIEFIRFDMSEYMEKHAVARLIGAPPGYIGHDQGGQLTDKIRKHPYSILLLDEIEKAHPDIFNILLQIMDHATLTDNNGKKADFRNVVVIMTSNAGTREMSTKTIGFSSDKRDTQNKGQKAIEKFFSPEFRNRLDNTITFASLPHSVIKQVVKKFLNQLKQQLFEKKVSLITTPSAVSFLAKEGYDPIYGARPIERLIQTEIKDSLSDEILFGKLVNGGKITIGIKNKKLKFSYA